MKKKFGTVLALGLSFGMSVAAYAGNLHATVIGGSDVGPSDPIAKMTVLLVGQTSKETYFCSGSIISQNMILTAAHCVDPAPEMMVAVFSPSLATATQTDIIPVLTGMANPGWMGEDNPLFSGADAHDIAVVMLRQNIPAGYQPAKLLPQSRPLSVGENVVVAGYGIARTPSQDPKGTTAGTLRTVDLAIAEPLGTTELGLDESGGKGSCSGDSGGPAYVRDGSELLLFGVTSRGDKNCSEEIIYTDVNAYLSWIQSAETQLQQFVQAMAKAQAQAKTQPQPPAK